MSLKLVQFESLDAVSYSPSTVTVAVSVAVCEIFTVRKWCDLENRVRVRSSSLKMAPFDRSHTNSYLPSIATIRGVYPRGVGRVISHIFKSGGLQDWLFQPICGAWLVRRIREKRR